MACPIDGIRLAQHSELAPFYYTSPTGTWRGLSIDYWRTVASAAKCDGIQMREYEYLAKKGEILIDGDISNGKVFSTTMPVQFLVSDPRDYAYTLPATYYKMMMVERNALGDQAEVASISFFIVFPLDIFLLFIVSCKIIDFLDYCFKKCRAGRTRQDQSVIADVFISMSDLLRYAIFSFSIVFLVWQWQGYFNGNNLLSIKIDGTPFLTLIAQFHQHSRQIVLDSFAEIFTENETLVLFGGNSSLIYGSSVKERLDLTCESASRVGIFQEYEYFEYLADQTLNQQCKLTQIIGSNTGIGWLSQAMTDGTPVTYLMPKNGTRRIREIMDRVLMTVFSEENVDNRLLTRHMPISMLRTIERRKGSGLTLNRVAMSLTQLQFPLVFIIIGILIALAAFMCEWILYTCKKRFACCRNRYCCCCSN